MAIEQREGHFRGDGGIELFYQSWAPPTPFATLVVTHGISEHSECYKKTAESLAALGWNVIAWDLRGHGRSEGKRGFVGDFMEYVRDLRRFLTHLGEAGRLDKPFALIGHSMGGLVTLRHLVDYGNPDPAAEPKCPKPLAVALSSPLVGIGVEVPFVKDFAARLLHRVWPSITLNNEIHYDRLTRDPQFLAGYPTDPLRHDKISPPLYFGMLSNIEIVKHLADRVRLPILIQAAGMEKIVSLPAIKEIFPKLGSENKKLIIYEDSYHEIFNDLDREKVFGDLHAFLQPILAGFRGSKK